MERDREQCGIVKSIFTNPIFSFNMELKSDYLLESFSR